nr:uncharacterized protein LOC111834252 [Paramormyrops kingsleyae]
MEEDRMTSDMCRPKGNMMDTVPQFKVLCTQSDMEQQFMVTQDVNMPNITNDSELNREGTGPAGEESESHQEMTEPAMELFPGSSGDLPLKIQQILCSELDMEQEPMATQNASMPNFASDSEHFKEGNESAGEESEADGFVLVPRMGHSTGPTEGTTLFSVIQILSLFVSKWNYINSSELLSTVFSKIYSNPSVKAHTVIAGETFNTHETFIQKLKLQIELCSAESSSVILVFCPVVSRIGTDMEVSMTRVPDNKPVILVFMHHCHSPSHMTNITVQPCRSNIVQIVQCAFHESKGLLQCQENEQAVAKVQPTLLRYVDLHAEVPQSSTEPVGERSKSHQCKDVRKKEDSSGSSGVPEFKVRCTYLHMKQQPMATQDVNKPNISNDSERLKGCNEPAGEEREADGWVIVSRMGHSTGPSEVKVHMLVAGNTFNFHDTFMEKLKLQIERCSVESSSVILVFCPVVSRIGTDMEAAMARVTGNKPVILVFMHHCRDPSHMTNITVQLSKGNIVQVIHCAFHESRGLLDCQENEQAVNAVRSTLLSKERIKLDGEESEFDGWEIISLSELSTIPSGVSTWLSAVVSWLCPNTSVKAHTLVAGETFNTHDTFIQKLKLQIKLCSAESSNVILLFCPVVSRIGTDMEAAMARVTENKPVILMFMHHCHDSSHMTNITVQPSRSNIVQVVHCAFHEYKGLLECQENEQAVKAVRSTLLRYK